MADNNSQLRSRMLEFLYFLKVHSNKITQNNIALISGYEKWSGAHCFLPISE